MQTNISKNATTGAGQAFGKVDDNIGSGMSVEVAVEIILKAIYLKRDDVLVGKFFYWVITRLCFMSNAINSLACDVKYKS